MPFHDFIHRLEQQLQLPLPGQDAHLKMASANRLRLKAQPNEKTRRSAVLILFYPYRDKIFAPLILRPKYDGVHAGQMAFPGGRYEKTDENSVTDIPATYKFSKGVNIKAGINNLTDARYFTRRAGGYPGPGALPADGRIFFISLGAKL